MTKNKKKCDEASTVDINFQLLPNREIFNRKLQKYNRKMHSNLLYKLSKFIVSPTY